MLFVRIKASVGSFSGVPRGVFSKPEIFNVIQVDRTQSLRKGPDTVTKMRFILDLTKHSENSSAVLA